MDPGQLFPYEQRAQRLEESAGMPTLGHCERSQSRRHEAEFFMGDQSLTGWWAWKQRYEAAAGDRKPPNSHSVVLLTWADAPPTATPDRAAGERHEARACTWRLLCRPDSADLLLCWAPALLSWCLAPCSLAEIVISAHHVMPLQLVYGKPLLGNEVTVSHHASLCWRIHRSDYRILNAMLLMGLPRALGRSGGSENRKLKKRLRVQVRARTCMVLAALF
jgi:hypothetical protein